MPACFPDPSLLYAMMLYSCDVGDPVYEQALKQGHTPGTPGDEHFWGFDPPQLPTTVVRAGCNALHNPRPFAANTHVLLQRGGWGGGVRVEL